MTFDQATRNRLQRFVSDARTLLTKEFTRQLQEDYGITPGSGEVAAMETLSYLDNVRRETARILRVTLEHYRANNPGSSTTDLLERIVREQAFTVLNRLAALRMAEAREFITESIAKGYESRGFQLYIRLAGTGLGETGDAYRSYLFSLFDEFALDLRVLFDRFSTMGRLFPNEPELLKLMKLMNDPEIADLWAEDETIGWIYQYFNSKDERKKMRDESAAPRNSRELAVRNQFFTPRYVVEFLTDNTLGRIWYEMTQGETALKDRCRYLVRRPTEIFLQEGAAAPESPEAEESLSQEELLKQPVYIPHRSLKDPREIRMLDPACGSMHFGLYAFDLYECIYEEAWDLEEQGIPFQRYAGREPLTATYASKDAFLRDVPRLIIEHNIHGVDIDPRAVQIAGLSLWLRAQKSWQGQELKLSARPQVQKSNVVCAEPMPGAERLLNEFLEQHLADTPEQQLVGQLVRRVFEAMKLAGEAGSLLQIEQEISKDVEEARLQWSNRPKSEQLTLSVLEAEPKQQELPLMVGEITDEYFWERVEGETYRALNRYAEQAENGNSYQRRLFANDAVRGFAFIDVCRQQYDVVVMNPPFGQPTVSSQKAFSTYPKDTPLNLYAISFIRAANMATSNGAFAAISDSTFLKQPTFLSTRRLLLSDFAPIFAIVDLGWGILDANVRTALSVIVRSNNSTFVAFDVADKDNREASLLDALNNQKFNIKKYSEVLSLPKSVFALDLSTNAIQEMIRMKSMREFCSLPWGCGANDSFRLFRLRWEVPETSINEYWSFMTNGGSFSPFYRENFLVCRYRMENGDSAFITKFRDGKDYLYDAAGQELYHLPGLTYPKRSEFFHVSVLPKNHIFTPEGKGLFLNQMQKAWVYLGVLNSSFVASMASIVCGPHKQRGDVELIKLPSLSKSSEQIISHASEKIFKLGRELMKGEETSTWFTFPGSSQIPLEQCCKIEQVISEHNKRIISFQTEALASIHQIDLEVSASIPLGLKKFCSNPELDQERSKLWLGLLCGVKEVISYTFGCVLGRWDVRYATGEKQIPEFPEPFDAPCVYSPGALHNEESFIGAGVGSKNYPLKIIQSGIVVDDEGNPNDISKCIRRVLQVIWGSRESDIEQEICEMLNVREIRDYFRQPTGFFADHLTRYSKSNRQAPIYLPLSTASGSYTLWLYYHRLTDQTLYTCINDYVEPKLNRVSETVKFLRSKTTRTRDEENDLEDLQTLEDELTKFRDELLRVAKLPWKPNLNDGVQITVAPLHSLFRLSKWQKKLKETWDKLEKGDYDWAHLAHSIWTARVREKCRTDKSLAIAHGLEDLYEPPPETPKRTKRKKRSNAYDCGLLPFFNMSPSPQR